MVEVISSGNGSNLVVTSGSMDAAPGTTEVSTSTKVAADEEALPLKKEEVMKITDLAAGLSSKEVQEALEKFGPNEIPAPSTPLYVIFLMQFVGFLPFLIEVAALISLAVKDYTDFGIIAGILLVNGLLGFREQYHAKKSLEEVSKSIEAEITVIRDSKTQIIPVAKLVPGDIVFLTGGVSVPADVKWLRGDVLKLDTAPMTGEPLPRKYPSKEYGDILLSGTTVVAGDCYGQVVHTGSSTEIGQAQASILKDKSVRVVSVFQTKIMTVVQILVTCCLAIVIAVLLVQGLVYQGKIGTDSLLDALSILIASIPVALPLVLQVNLALGASFLAKEHHAIVTSIPALQDIASMSMLCSDKTGTLTTAKMSIITDSIYSGSSGRYSTDEVLLYSYLCANVDKKDDPIDRAIINAYLQSKDAEQRAAKYKRSEIIGFNANVKRVVAFVEDDKGGMITIAKGLPGKILDTESGGVDDHELQWKVDNINDKNFMQTVTETDRSLSSAGYKTIAVAVCHGNARELANPVWEFVGLLPMLDPPRKDTAATIYSLHHCNISVKMITGDHVQVGKETARLIGLGTKIYAGEEIRKADPGERNQLIWEADGFAAVLPSDKREVVLTLRNEFGVVCGMTGDGVNDSPALSAAQVGIAVEGATDAAKNAADLILTEPGLAPIYGAVLESRRIFARIKSYVVYRVAASIMLVLTLSTVIFASGCAVDSLLVIILALLNDISMIPVAYDNASATSEPQLPNAQKLVLQSLFFGLIYTAGALVFIFSMAGAPDLKHPIELDSNCDAETRGFIWFYLVLASESAIFSVRAPSFFWKSRPSPILVASVIGTCIGSAFVAIYASDLSPDNMGYIILCNIAVFIIADVGKIWFRKYVIHDEFGEIIETDDLLEPPPIQRNETEKMLEKELRYQVHRRSMLSAGDVVHNIEVKDSGLMSNFFDMQASFVTDGFVNKQNGGKYARVRSMSTPLGGGGGAGRRARQSSVPTM